MAFHQRKLLSAVELDPVKKPDAGGINPAKHPTTVIVLSLGIVGAAFLFLSYLAIRRYTSRRRSSLPLETRSNREDFTDALQEPAIDHPIWYIRTIGLPQSVVDSIAMLSYKRGDGLVETSDCSVCLTEFEEGDNLRLLPKCSHAFHVACIDTWLRSHTNCPLCRAPVRVSPAESSESRVENESEMIESSPVVSGVEDDREMEAVRRSLSLDFSSHLRHNKAFPINKSTSFSFTC